MKKRIMPRLTSLLVLLAILIPMVAMAAFAAEARANWSFMYDGTTQRTSAPKSNSLVYASVTASAGNLGGNSVSCRIENYAGSALSYSNSISSIGQTVRLNYINSIPSGTVYLAVRGSTSNQQLGGVWTP